MPNSGKVPKFGNVNKPVLVNALCKFRKEYFDADLGAKERIREALRREHQERVAQDTAKIEELQDGLYTLDCNIDPSFTQSVPIVRPEH